MGLVVDKANTFELVMHTQHIFIVGQYYHIIFLQKC